MIEIILLAIIAGFTLEFIDSFLGGGYGTVLTPLFLVLGFALPQIVPMILLSEILTGLIGGAFHHNFGHVDKKAIKYVTPFAICGTLFAIFTAINVNKFWINLYVGLLVLILGILMFIRYWKNRNKNHISEKTHNHRLPFIGSLIGFNKGLTAGGFGPILTGGLSWSGYDAKKAVGSTTLTEGLVCVVGFIGYWLTNGINDINWTIAIPLIIGACLATFPAAYVTNRIPKKILGVLVSITIVILGIAVLAKLPR